MARVRINTAKGGILPSLAAVAVVTFALPTAGLAVTGITNLQPVATAGEFAPFTPAAVDPQLARRVAASLHSRQQGIRFTPASTPSSQDRTYTVAVRVDDQTARAISLRSALSGTQGDPGVRAVTIAPTRYNLGVARGYQSFVKTPTTSRADSSLGQNAYGQNGLNQNGLTQKALGLRNVAMPDLADFKPTRSSVKNQPSRFQPLIAMESEKGTTGRSQGTLESLGEQSVDLGGAYRVTRNLNVTAGVRLSQDRDRIAPLTDSVQDSQAVYVGTQFRF